MNFLDTVIPVKQVEVKKLIKKYDNNCFVQLFKNRKNETIFIAEIKPKSPSAGQLINSNPLLLVNAYEKGNADAISVLTDSKFFGGNSELFAKIRKETNLPLLRKDFIIDESQLVESLLLGADTVLIIVQLVTEEKLKDLITFTKKLGLVPLVEVISEEELELAIRLGAEYIGVNSRDLRTMKVDPQKALEVLRKIPVNLHSFLFSGIETPDQVKEAVKSGAQGLLIGTSLIRSTNPSAKLKTLKTAAKEQHAG
jgi:indole-3-glycerol phosphate synthase